MNSVNINTRTIKIPQCTYLLQANCCLKASRCTLIVNIDNF